MPIVKDQLGQQMHPYGTSSRNQANALTHNPIMRKIYNNPNDLQIDTAEVELKECYWCGCFFLLDKEDGTMKFKTVGKVMIMQTARRILDSVYATVANLWRRYFKKSSSIVD